MNMRSLESLVGIHYLSGVSYSFDFDDLSLDDMRGYYESGAFVLDGILYGVIEDPDDGYRSMMRGVLCDLDYPIVCKDMQRFPPVRVDCRIVEDDILSMVDMESGMEVLRLGTDNDDSWYPLFVFDYQPQHMVHNARPKFEKLKDDIDHMFHTMFGDEYGDKFKPTMHEDVFNAIVSTRNFRDNYEWSEDEIRRAIAKTVVLFLPNICVYDL